MVCNRCILVVEELFRKMDIQPLSVELGVVVLPRELSSSEQEGLEHALGSLGFELLDGKRERQTEQVKNLIVGLVHYSDEALKVNLSDYIAQRLSLDYNYISTLFSEVEGTTIEKYFIAQKIEKVKELLVYDELSLSEIADRLNYSSAAHLSTQFKKVTGLTPSHFKRIGEQRRKPLDEV